MKWKWSTPLKAQVYGFLLSMPFIDLALQVVLFDKQRLTDWRIWVISFPLIYVIGLGSWYMHVQYEHFIERLFPSLKQTPKRIFYKTFINLLVMTPSVLFIFWIYNFFYILGYHL